MMVDVGDLRIMSIMAETTNTIAEGEVLQLINCHDADTTEARYLAVIRRKTAKLFEAGGRCAAVLAGKPDRAGAGRLRNASRLCVPADRRSITAAPTARPGKTSATTWPRASRRCR